MSDEPRTVEVEALPIPQDVRVFADAPRTVIRLKAPRPAPPAPPPPPPAPRPPLKVVSFLGRPAAGGPLAAEVRAAADGKVVLAWSVEGASEVSLEQRAGGSVPTLVATGLPLAGEREAVVDGPDVSFSLEARAGNALAEARVHVLSTKGPVRVRLLGMLFESDKTFLLPGALGSMKAFKRIFDERAPGTLLVNGHTDSRGKRDYNLGLSTERATALRAYLKDDADDWLARYAARPHGQPWGVREDKHMLAQLKHHDGAIDSVAGPKYEKAVKAFRSAKGLGAGGMDARARKALIAAYMAEDGTSLPAATRVVVHGCGEHHPAKDVGDEVAEAENRRVEVFLFQDEARPAPRSPCGAGPPGCPEYPEWVKTTIETIDLREPLRSLEVRVVDDLKRPVKGATAAVAGELVTTGDDGVARFGDLLPFLGLDVLVTGRGYEPAEARVARTEGSVTVTLVPRTVHVLMGKQGEPLARALLKGDDGSVRELTRRDARPFDDEHLIVEFREVLDGVRYSLYQVLAPGVHLPFFEDVPEQDLPRPKAVERG